MGGVLTSEERDRLLNQTIYSWDVSSLLSGVVDFLEFSEGNLSWQRRREIRKVEEQAASLEFEPKDAHFLPQARAQIIEAAEYRFDVGLSQSVRYAGLVAYATCVEWCSRLFSARLAQPLPKKPKGENEAVHALEYLNERVARRLAHEIETFRQVVCIRNCVVHSAGLVKGDKHEAEIRKSIGSIPGFGVSSESFLGESVHIEEDAVEDLARAALVWLPSLDEECTSNGTFRPHL